MERQPLMLRRLRRPIRILNDFTTLRLFHGCHPERLISPVAISFVGVDYRSTIANSATRSNMNMRIPSRFKHNRTSTKDQSDGFIDKMNRSSVIKNSPLRVMPLGGSITYGSGSTEGNGYRSLLSQLLTSDGYKIEMVGSRKAGTMLNNQHEGWRGFTIDQIWRKACNSLPRLLPDVITINAGSNDCIQNLEIDSIGERMGNLLNCIRHICPKSTIILSTLVVNSDVEVEARVLQANTQFRELFQQQTAKSERLVLVDMHNLDGPQQSDLVDGTHPGDRGYDKMARIWHKGIQEALSRGFLEDDGRVPSD